MVGFTDYLAFGLMRLSWFFMGLLAVFATEYVLASIGFWSTAYVVSLGFVVCLGFLVLGVDQSLVGFFLGLLIIYDLKYADLPGLASLEVTLGLLLIHYLNHQFNQRSLMPWFLVVGFFMCLDSLRFVL